MTKNEKIRMLKMMCKVKDCKIDSLESKIDSLRLAINTINTITNVTR